MSNRVCGIHDCGEPLEGLRCSVHGLIQEDEVCCSEAEEDSEEVSEEETAEEVPAPKVRKTRTKK